jgi:hypothetical protein
VDPGCARAAPALPYRRWCLCRRLRRTSCGRGRRGGASSSAPRSRRRPRPRLTTRWPPRPAGRPHAGWQVSVHVPVWRRCPCCLARARPGGAVARRRSRLGLARMSGYGQDAPKRRPRCRPIRRRATPPRTRRRLGSGLLGRGLHGFAGGSKASLKTRRRQCVTCRRPRPRRTSPGRASAWRVPCPFRALAPVRALAPERVSHSWAHAPAVPPVRARGRGSLVHPTGRSAVGRSGGVRSQPAPLAARPRSLDPSCYSLRSERGGDPDPGTTATSTRSCVMDVPSPTQRQPPCAGLKTCSYNRSFLSGGRAACLAILSGIACGVARHLNSFFPHLGRRGSAAGPVGARL